MKMENEKLADMYRRMVRIRLFEERVVKEFAAGNIPGFVHVYSGEEAVAVGACANLTSEDYITSTHRGHGHLIAKGGRTDRMMAELYGKKTGYNKGPEPRRRTADMDDGHASLPEIGVDLAVNLVERPSSLFRFQLAPEA